MNEWYHLTDGQYYYGPPWRRYNDKIKGEYHWAPLIPSNDKEIIKNVARIFGPLINKKVKLEEKDLDSRLIEIAINSKNFRFNNINKNVLLMIDAINRDESNFKCYCNSGYAISWSFYKKKIFRDGYIEISLNDVIKARPTSLTFYIFCSSIANKLRSWIETRKNPEMKIVFGKWYNFLSKEINHKIFLGYVTSCITNKKSYIFNIITGESLRVLLEQVSLDKIISLTKKFSNLESNIQTYKYTLQKLIELKEKIDRRKLFSRLAEEGIPNYEFVFCLKRKEANYQIKITSLLYGLAHIFGFIIDKKYWQIILQIIKLTPIVNLIYNETKFSNPLLYKKILEDLGIKVNVNVIRNISGVFRYKIYTLQYVQHIEDFLNQNPSGTAEEFAEWYQIKKNTLLSSKTLGKLRNSFRRYQELKPELDKYNIDSYIKKVREYVESIEDWDKELVSIVKKL